MSRTHTTATLPLLATISLLSGCFSSPLPKPRGYPRVYFPEKAYRAFTSDVCPFIFQMPAYGEIAYDTLFFDTVPPHPCWLNIHVPALGATIHLTYKPLPQHSLAQLIQDAHFMAYKHTIKAEFIKELPVNDTSRHLYGTVYKIGGNAASNYQFYLTDREHHFVRGALYIKATPNIDSLQPVVAFLEQDLEKLIATWQWTDTRSRTLHTTPALFWRR